ncbi:MAG TPA: CRISPR-associated endonuclease Cas3'' [Azospirillaceae bacterium]|nr:CRISPR-associated endonuclease Cas3'' [Azospirillaceae bacterium]
MSDTPRAQAPVYAHSVSNRPRTEWEALTDHSSAVASLAGHFAASFGWEALARVAGLLHDIGKCSLPFQDYIGATGKPDAPAHGPDHSTAGAREAEAAYPKPLGRMLAYVVAGHHAGLADFPSLEARLGKALAPYDGWRDLIGPLPPARALVPSLSGRPSSIPGFTTAFLTRMLFSCLVDADFLETERFYAEVEGRSPDRGGHTDLAVLRDRLAAEMAKVRSAARTPLHTLRNEILDHAVGKAALDPGLFTLTVPTGGGKTLTSLSFALEHAVRHGLRRVIYVIPFTSVIEQTADVFRKVLGTNDDILEHHASFDWERGVRAVEADDEGPGGLRKLRRAAENWDVPIVVTTAVQFFESLFANRPSTCRKLHNIAQSVVVLDEVQTLPLHLLRPCMAVADELQRNYRTSIVLCTATQPALREKDGFKNGGFKIDDDRELAPRARQLYADLKRVEVEPQGEPVADAVIVRRFAEQPQMLCIVNSRAHARTLFDAIRDQEGAAHLSTLMCPRHRRAVLADLRTRLKDKQPVRLVATSLIEAGVDISFPEVWRAAAGLDSIAQAAGRCNREGELLPNFGRAVVFTPAEAKPPKSLEAFWQAARGALRKHSDPLTLDAIRDYFTELYWQKGEDAFDVARLDGQTWPILRAIRERAKDGTFEFESIARAFRMIEDAMEPVVVPWRSHPDDDETDALLNRIAGMDRPRATDLRQLQQYTVSIPREARQAWLAKGVLRPVHHALGPALLRFDDLALYRPETGLDLQQPEYRNAEANVW